MAWQLWHLTEIFSAFQPRWSSGMPRKAATKSCSTMTSTPEADSSAWAGETVPQKGQTSAFLAGFHCDSPPQDGQENFFCAVASDINNLMSHDQWRVAAATRAFNCSMNCSRFFGVNSKPCDTSI